MTLDLAIEKIKSYLSSYTLIPPTEFLYFISLLSIRKLNRGDYFYKQGDEFKLMGFVVKGLLHNFYIKNEEEITNYFISEGEPATCYANLLTNTPASFNCRAIENTYLLVINYEDFKKLYSRHSCWERIGRLGAEKVYIEKENRESEFLLLTGEERYHNFVKRNPHLINRVPLNIIATYIGLRPQSLSRIRAKTTK